MFGALNTLVFCCDHLRLLILWSTLMLIGLVVRIRASPPRAMLCSSGTIPPPGPPSVRTPSQDPVLKLSIALWPMVLPRLHGYANFCRSFTLLFAALRWCIVITSAQYTCPPTLSSINVPSTSRLIYTASGSGFPLVIVVFFMSRLRRNMQISSPKAFRLQFSRSLGPI